MIDSLLADLESSGIGVCIDERYLGSLAHADDLQSITLNIDLLEQQGSIIKEFTKKNGLKLNEEKLVLQEFSKVRNPPSSIRIGESVITANGPSMCLGTFFLHNLSPKKSILIITSLYKARRAFFCSPSQWNCIWEAKPTHFKRAF